MALKLNLKKSAKSNVLPVATSAGNLAVQAASDYRAIALEADDVSARLKVSRETLMSVVGPERDKELAKGNADTSIKIPTLDGNRVMVVYQERFRGLDITNVAPLKNAFGSNYALFCEETQGLKLKTNSSVAGLEAVIGKAAMKKLLASGLITQTEAVKPRKGAFESIARLYVGGETETAEDLTMFVDACNSQPQVRAK
jgi:hypothetical protein